MTCTSLLVVLLPLHRTAESSCNRNWKSVNCPALSWEIWQPLTCVFVEADKPVSKIDMGNKGPKNSQTPKKKNWRFVVMLSECVVKTYGGRQVRAASDPPVTTKTCGRVSRWWLQLMSLEGLDVSRQEVNTEPHLIPQRPCPECKF